MGEKIIKLLCCVSSPRKSISGVSAVHASAGGEHLYPLNPCWLLLMPPQKNNLGVPMPPCTQTSSKTKAFPCCSSRRPLPVKDGRTGGVFVPGGVAAWLLSAGAAGSAMQPLREAAR